MIRIACLHTAPSNEAVLEAAAVSLNRPDLTLTHVLRADLLDDLERAGSLTASIRARGDDAIHALLDEHDGVLVTCSSIGELASGDRVQRVDLALAREAARSGRSVTVLCASPTTQGPTTDLFTAAAAETGARVDVHVVEGAWPMFRSGDTLGYFRTIADAAVTALAGGADMVALAQVSMSGAVDLVPNAQGRVLAAPQVALRAMLDSLG